MNESEFHRAVDAILARVERAAEACEGIDADLEAGILTLECPDGSRIIVNRQTPNREIWVAARSGGFHFAFRDGAWRDTRTGAELLASLSAITGEQAGESLRFG
jgi:CyaY protein